MTAETGTATAEPETESGTDWVMWAKVALIVGAALGALAGLPWYLGKAAQGDFILFSGMMLGFGALFFGIGWSQYKKRRLMLDTPTSKVRSLAVGAAEVKGDAEPVDEVLTSPLTHRDACMFHLEVREDEGDDEGRETVLELEEHVPFHVDDGTGTVPVEPEDADLELETEKEIHVPAGERPPEAVRRWAEETGVVDDASEHENDGLLDTAADMVLSEIAGDAEEHLVRTSGGERVYREQVLEAGEETYVFGGAYRREDADSDTNERNLVMREHDGTGAFIVSDRAEDDVANRKLVETVGLLGFGVVGIAFGLVGLIGHWGLV